MLEDLEEEDKNESHSRMTHKKSASFVSNENIHIKSHSTRLSEHVQLGEISLRTLYLHRVLKKLTASSTHSEFKRLMANQSFSLQTQTAPTVVYNEQAMR